MCCLLPCVKALRSTPFFLLIIARMKQYNSMCPTTARVLREGRVLVLDAGDLVVGDIVISLLSHSSCRSFLSQI